MGYLHEFEDQRPDSHNMIGIEIESAPTIDIVQQKRTATTTRSMKNRQRTSKQPEILGNQNLLIFPRNFHLILVPNPEAEESSILDENSNEIKPISSSPTIDEPRSNISSSIGPIISTPSPRFQKPVSLTSTKTYFDPIQQQDSPPILQVKTPEHNGDQRKESSSSHRPRASSLRHGDKKETIGTVRFTNESESTVEETYL